MQSVACLALLLTFAGFVSGFSLQGNETPAVSAVAGHDCSVPLSSGETLEFVWIDALQAWVGKYEVTNGQFRCMNPDHNVTSFEGHALNGKRQPVVYVSYHDALAFCQWATAQAQAYGLAGAEIRLPTPAEWVAFAQCGDGRKYPWGNEWPPAYGNYADESAEAILSGSHVIHGYKDDHAVTCDVEKSGCNPWKLFGVGGNVSEWTSEGFASSQVLQGASWFDHRENLLTCEFHVRSAPDYSYSLVGFRCLLKIEASQALTK